MSAEVDGPRIRVLVVDDSAVIRRLVSGVLAAEPRLEVVGTAENGKVALERVAELRPDAVTMDIEMPVMDGITAVSHLRRSHPRLPIVMFSTLTERGAAATLDALAAGASDYVAKPSNTGSIAQSQQEIRDQLVPKLIALAARFRPAPAKAAEPKRADPGLDSPKMTPRVAGHRPPAVLAIGSSTGGPDALATVLSRLPAGLPVPVVVVQHMPPVFTRLLAQRLDKVCPLSVREAQDGAAVLPGTVLIAPGGFHLEVRRSGVGCTAAITEDPAENFCRPSVDVLFRSVARSFGDRVLAVVLTGMGRDGAEGAGVIRAAGGRVIVQDRESSVVWGMPGAVAGAGWADEQLPLAQIGPALVHAVGRREPSGREAVAPEAAR